MHAHVPTQHLSSCRLQREGGCARGQTRARVRPSVAKVDGTHLPPLSAQLPQDRLLGSDVGHGLGDDVVVARVAVALVAVDEAGIRLLQEAVKRVLGASSARARLCVRAALTFVGGGPRRGWGGRRRCGGQRRRAGGVEARRPHRQLTAGGGVGRVNPGSQKLAGDKEKPGDARNAGSGGRLAGLLSTRACQPPAVIGEEQVRLLGDALATL